MPYIDSEFLKKKIFPYGMADNGNYGINAKSVMVAIEKAPEIDAVEVVRCKDCVNLRASADGYSFCAKWDVDSYEEAMVRFDDFCSYGERRGG